MTGEKFHLFAHLTLPVHDISVGALALAVIMLGVVLLMELRAVLRLRSVVDGQLGRVFEQLDLLRFETQQLLEGQQALQAPGPAANAIRAPAQRPAPGTEAAALALPVLVPSVQPPAVLVRTSGEARLLSSLAEARARRAQAAGA